MRVVILFLFVLFFNVCAVSQVSQINITGTLVDTSGVRVTEATIMLLNKKDSTLLNYTTTNLQGVFSFKNVKNTGYILKMSHISYMPVQKNIPVSPVENVELGVISVYPMSEILMEVVIKGAKAPLFIHGDTVEYDARTFKVPPGSTVEDLLRRLPGITVDASGNITTMGKDVRRVYVDGKTFFGDDPTTVTKNLDAEAISKVQVFDEKSEQERLSGVSDGSQEKVMNLELKEEYKKGYFGKASLAAGTSDRLASRGSYNKFSETQQLSFIAYANNINQAGVNWDEYSEFKGQSAYSDRDNGDFGFGFRGGDGYYYYSGIGGFNNGMGFSENYGGGVNYNYFKKKVKFNVSYLYNQTDQDYELFTKRQDFLVDTSFIKFDTLNYGEFRNSHSFSTRTEYEFDSLNAMIISINTRLSGNAQNKSQTQRFFTPDLSNINMNSISNTADYDSKSINALSIFRHNFRKKGRVYGLSTAIDFFENDNIDKINNHNIFFISPLTNETLKLINESYSNQIRVKSSAMYVEPLSDIWSLMSFYNFNTKHNISRNISRNPDYYEDAIDSLSIFNPMDVTFNRAGSQITFSKNGINLTAGGAWQIINMSGSYSIYENEPSLLPPVNRNFTNFIPYFSTYADLPHNFRLNGSYSYSITEPQFYNLQPAPNISNISYRTIGNPSLRPEESHSFNGSLGYWNQASFTNFSLNIRYNLYNSKIVYNQSTIFEEGTGYVTVSSPVNIDGAKNYSTYAWSSFPIIKTKLSTNFSASYYNYTSPVYINTVKNITNSNNYRGNVGLNLTPGTRLSFSADFGYSLNTIDYSIQKSLNQTIINISSDAGLKYRFAKKSYLEGNYNIVKYNSDLFDNIKDITLINISIRQLIGKKNRFEARLACIDLLDQNKYTRQYGAVNYIENAVSPTLSRYIMLSITFNMKGFENKLEDN